MVRNHTYNSSWNNFYKPYEKMNSLKIKYKKACEETSDINEHISTLKKYADFCEHVTEFGVRSAVSTWAWVASNAKTIRCYDINSCEIGDHQKESEKLGKEFSFTRVNTIAEKFEIEPTDLLFIDTDHTYKQCSQELRQHAYKVKKFIIFHDTVSFALELNKAIEEFLEKNNDWMLREKLLNNNGLTIIAKK